MTEDQLQRFERLVDRFENAVYSFHTAMNELKRTIEEAEKDDGDDWKRGTKPTE